MKVSPTVCRSERRLLPGLHWRIAAWLVIVMEVGLPFASTSYAVVPAPAAPRVMPRYPEPVLTPTNVAVNRKVPNVEPPGFELKFSANPTDGEIFRARALPIALVSTRGQSGAEENRSLANTLVAIKRGERAAPLLEAFLQQHPGSPKRAAVLANLATLHRRTGRFTKALAAWEEAWDLSKGETGREAAALADEMIAELATFTVSLGRTEPLERLLKEVENRAIRGTAAERIDRARSALWEMKNRPGTAFKCGPFSIYRIRAALGLPEPAHPLILDEQSTPRGTSLAQMHSLAQKLGMQLQPAKRRPGAEIIVPAMIHWNLGHFSALTKIENGLYVVEDTTFPEGVLTTKETLDEEASGYFLIPDGPLPAGWESVSPDEAANIWGRMTPTAQDPDGPGPCDPKGGGYAGGGGGEPCKGMPQYSVSLMHVSLNIADVPVGYKPPRGPAVDFRITYNHRENNQPQTFTFANLGRQWTCDFISFMEDDGYPYSQSPSLTVKCYLPGGGVKRYTGAGTNGLYSLADNGSQLLRFTNSYERELTDGTKYVYAVPERLADTSGVPRKIFLSEIRDAHGNAVTLTYDANFRIVAVTDAIGQVSTVTYASTNSADAAFYRIARFEDPFGRYATVAYNGSGQLTNITDVIGISSSFTYGTGDFIRAMTTPYGTTQFTNYTYGLVQWIEVTDPLGAKERFEFRDSGYASGIGGPDLIIPASEYAWLVPTNIATYNGELHMRNTFYWDKKAMQEAPGDYMKAQIFHWAYSANSFYILSSVVESSKLPLEGRAWYNYPQQSSSRFAGTSRTPTKTARVLDDGSTQLYTTALDEYGRITNSIDPLGRKTIYRYTGATNSVFRPVQEVWQANATTNDLLLRVSWTNSLPVQIVTAGGATNALAFNSYGQLLAITNPLNEVTLLSYNTNGYLTNVAAGGFPALQAFAYDAYGRVRTVSDSEGYTLIYDYDALDRPTKITFPDGTYEAIVYTQLDPVLRRDRTGRWTASTYNAVRQLTSVRDALGRVTTFDWCKCGSLESLTDPMGRTTTWLRDLQGRPTAKIYTDGTAITYGYEQRTSSLKSVTDAKNQTTIYDYFKDNNLKQVTYSNATIATPSVSFTYDTNYNRLLTMTDGIGTTTYGYYPVTNGQLGADKLASVDGPLANDTVTYGYDAAGRVVSRAINSIAQTVLYDALGRVTVLTNALGSFTNLYIGATTRVATNFYPNGQRVEFGYYGTNDDQRLQTIWNRKSSGDTISRFDYSYTADGQIKTWTQQADNDVPQVWVPEYDTVNQLLGVTVRSNSVAGNILKQFAYAYDAAGNRTSETIVTPGNFAMSSAAANSLNQLVSVAGGGLVKFKGSLNEIGAVTVGGTPAAFDTRTSNFVGHATTSTGTNVVSVVAADYSGNSRTNTYEIVVTNNGAQRTLTYDLNGNLVSNITATATNTYEWDAANRLVAINAGTNRSEFTYDAAGRRARIVEKTNGVVQTDQCLLWVDGELCEERNATGATTTQRFFGPGEQIGGTNFCFTQDHLGNVREMLDNSGAGRARYEYEPYGQRVRVSGDLDADFGFTGHYYHRTSGLHLALYRAYDSSLGRWLSRDPIEEEGGLNYYSYVGGNPIQHVDLYGLDLLDSLGAAASRGYGRGGLGGNAVGVAANVAEALLNTVGGETVRGLAQQAGCASGAGDTLGAIGYGGATAGVILLNAFSFGRLGRLGGLRPGMNRPNAAFPRGTERIEFSHWVPNRFGGPRSWANGNRVWGTEHALSDPSRHQFLRQWWKADNPLPSTWIQQWNRLPNWLVGTAGVGAAQGAGLVGRGGGGGCP